MNGCVRLKSGQAKTGYVLGVVLISIAAIGVVTQFGNIFSNQAATAAGALAGEERQTDDKFLSVAAAMQEGQGLAHALGSFGNSSSQSGKQSGSQSDKQSSNAATGKEDKKLIGSKEAAPSAADGKGKGGGKSEGKGKGKEGSRSSSSRTASGHAWSENPVARAAQARENQGGWGKLGYRGLIHLGSSYTSGIGWANSYKCNLFVNWVTQEGGATPPLVNGRQATAGELKNPNQHIEGWEVVTDGSLQDGDIIAGGGEGEGYTGHTGIVVFQNGIPQSISASSRTRRVEWNDWGFSSYMETREKELAPGFEGTPQRPFVNEGMVIRRYKPPGKK